ncbi:MAG: hypothetical protein AAF146_04520 [Bacteroidota bacterium]
MQSFAKIIGLLSLALCLGQTVQAQKKVITFRVEKVIPHPAEKVWAVVGEDYGAIANSHPKIIASDYVSGTLQAGEGAERVCYFNEKGSQFLKEKMTNYNPREMTFVNKVYQAGRFPVNPDYTFWKDLPASSLNITDLDYHDGFLYVAGLSNGEFASNLRKIAYPFSDQQAKVGSIEMYHAVHTQKETRAPIRAMVFDELDGASTLIASYTCTPLVTIPTADIQEGKHIKAKTIAELGFGNAPVDMLTFMVQEQDGSFDKKLLITHKQRGGNVISLKDLAEANQGAGMEGKFTMGPEGVKLFQVSTANVLHIDDQNQMMLAALRRNMENGDLELVSQLKGSYFRLSDFVSEYNFPDYRYPEEQEGTKKFHDMVKPMEGYPELTSEKMGRE